MIAGVQAVHALVQGKRGGTAFFGEGIAIDEVAPGGAAAGRHEYDGAGEGKDRCGNGDQLFHDVLSFVFRKGLILEGFTVLEEKFQERMNNEKKV
jgi:hypothetical protein